MLIDVVLPGWVPFANLSLSQDLPGFVDSHAKALSYPFSHLIGGHLGRLGGRADVTLQQQYLADITAGAKRAIDTVDATPYFEKYGNNTWAAVKTYLDAVTDQAAAPVIAKYTGVLAAADVFTTGSTFALMESIRLDLGYPGASTIHP